MKTKMIPTTAQRAAQLLAKATRFDNGFRRQYPLLVDYIDGRRPLNDCSTTFYRKKSGPTFAWSKA
ncbi:hypothetical protein [Desulfosarcina cetonica]|uniref:hypothetical protein n=1 Tax=Desulfosarcina cetonica TaxID=90730 RepID=UPI0006D29FCE|nr:hypothetical protein [Desulfosarcina cetonica]